MAEYLALVRISAQLDTSVVEMFDPKYVDLLGRRRAAWDVPPLAAQLARADLTIRTAPQPPMDGAPDGWKKPSGVGGPLFRTRRAVLANELVQLIGRSQELRRLRRRSYLTRPRLNIALGGRTNDEAAITIAIGSASGLQDSMSCEGRCPRGAFTEDQ